jgi:hypothetical protein
VVLPYILSVQNGLGSETQIGNPKELSQWKMLNLCFTGFLNCRNISTVYNPRNQVTSFLPGICPFYSIYSLYKSVGGGRFFIGIVFLLNGW